MKTNIIKGMIAAFIGTIVLSMAMIMKGKMGLMPELDIIHMLASKMGGSAAVGWIAHFMVGTVGYGVAFGIGHKFLPTNSYVVKSVLLALSGWMGMMLVLMPMMGAGLFGMKMGIMAAVMTMMLHVIFGVSMGNVYRILNKKYDLKTNLQEA